jgi:cation transport ATPase
VARQGIWVGMGLSGIAMIFAAFGYIDPAFGAILQEGIDFLVILNALRAGRPTPRHQ